MPWNVFKTGGENEPYCVYKVSEDGEREGGSLGCHPSEDAARQQVEALYANEAKTAKAIPSPNPGDYLVVEDREKKSTWHLQVKENGTPNHRLMGAAWAALHGGYRGNRYEGPGKQEAVAKLRKLYASEDMDVPGGSKSVKAVGDWELEVLGAPYGGPHRGKDSDGEYFNSTSNFHLDKFPNPMVMYYHGYGPDGTPVGNPDIIGKAVSVERRGDGVWYRVLLDKGNEFARRVWDAAQHGLARASSGSISHLVRKAADGLLTNWPIVELSLFDTGEGREPANNYAVALPVMKSHYKTAGIDLPTIPEAEGSEGEDKGEEQRSEPVPESKAGKSLLEDLEMDDKEIKSLVGEAVAEALVAERKAREEAERAEAEAKEAEEAKQAEIKAAVEKALKEEREKEAEKNRLPGGAPTIAKFSEIWKYDNIDAGDQALMVGILSEGKKARISKDGASKDALKALAVKLSEDKSRVGAMGRQAMKAAGIKSDEVMQQDLTTYGDEWVGVAYSQALWEAIRVGTFVAENLPSIEVPAGHESIVLPLEGADPTYYKVAETTDHDSTMLFPVASVTSSKMATGNKTLSLVKMGARVPWSGELEEDSLIPFVAQLRKQLVVAGAEQLEHAIIDGDTATTASTNINDIGSTGATAGTELYLLFNGFRKSPLVTTTANSRDGGVLTAADFLETVKLMGTAGINALAKDRVAFIMDVNTHWKALELEEVKTRDVFAQPTIENGMLTGIWGYKCYTSPNMHYISAKRMANTAGKVHVTDSNNTTGSILAVRWDQWLLGYRRRMTLETTRYPRSDSSEIVALMRLGLVQRDTEASAISYDLTL